MHLYRFRKADSLAHQTLEARAQRQMLPFNLLRIPFTRGVHFRLQVSPVRTPIIRMKAPDPEGLQQRFQLHKYLIRAPTKDIRQDGAGPVIDGMPEPPLLLLLSHKAPHFIDFGLINPADGDLHIARM